MSKYFLKRFTVFHYYVFLIILQSQLIIITGSTYEALASEEIQLNMANANSAGVTCTVIKGVTCNQVCGSDSKLKAMEDEDSLPGLLHLRLVVP